MKYLIITSLFLTSNFLISQNSTDPVFSEANMISLRQIVDSINIEFDSISNPKFYKSKRQGICNILFYQGDLYKEIEDDVVNGKDIKELLKKYPECSVVNDQLVTFARGTREETSEYLEMAIVPIDMFATSIYIDPDIFNKVVGISDTSLIPRIKFPNSGNNSFCAIQLKTVYPNDIFAAKYHHMLLYNSTIINGFEDFLNKQNKQNINDFVKIAKSKNGASFLEELNIDVIDFYFGSYLRYENEEEKRSFLIPLYLYEILYLYDKENSLELLLSVSEDLNLDVFNRYHFLVLAQRFNQLSESKEIFERNNRRINQTIETFPEDLISKLRHFND